MYIDRSGNVREMSNLPTPVFDSRARDAFAYAQSLLSNGQHSLPSPHTAYRLGHRGHSSRAGRSKRRRTGFREEPLNVEVVEAYEDPEDQVPLEIGDTKKVTEFYTMAFKRLQQINCRLLAKNFIKLIEPRKQVRHPYNGGRRPGGAPGERGDPEETKPDWWPRDVIHKEPDHIKKECKICELPSLDQFTDQGQYRSCEASCSSCPKPSSYGNNSRFTRGSCRRHQKTSCTRRQSQGKSCNVR